MTRRLQIALILGIVAFLAAVAPAGMAQFKQQLGLGIDTVSRPPSFPQSPANSDPALADETLLKTAGLATDSAGLVEFFRMRGQTDVPADRVAALIKLLDAPTLSVREKAGADLIALGPPALPHLRRVAKDTDNAEASALARRCLKALDANSGTLTGAAARLLAVRRPAGATETLLAFLPYAENDSVIDEVKVALMSVAYRDGKPDAALVKALGDDLPLRRATAIEVLCHNGVAEPRATLRKLLQDPVPIVRLQAGLALAQANDGEAIGTLIGILADLPPAMVRQVEDHLYTLAGDQGPKPIEGTDAATREKQRDAWKAWWEANDGTAALTEFRKRTLTDVDREKGLKLILNLGDDDFDTREKATEELRTLGSNMIPLLRVAAAHADIEVSRRVRAILTAIEKDKSTPLPLTAPRIVAVRKPQGAATALLAFLPLAEDETTVTEIQSALNSLAYAEGKPDPTLVKALEDKVAVRRGAAAVALCQSPTGEMLIAVRKLLKDSEPTVRLNAALGLAGARDREAVPVLIALIGELPVESAAPAEEYLRRLAADRLPEMPTGEGDLRQKRREAWEAWWTAQGAKAELVERLPPPLLVRYLGHTVLIQSQNGMVTELGADGKQRWQLTGLSNPMDAQVLPGDRVLVAEYGMQKVTERNLKGEILWEKRTNTYPVSARRLANGNTFIVARNQLLEVDRSGKEVFNYNRPNNDIMTAVKLRDGQIVCVTSRGQCVRLSADGKEGKSFPIQGVSVYGNEVLPNGHVLIPVTYQNKIVEYDTEGKTVWQGTAIQPMSAMRLPNGNTVVATQESPAKVIELDRQGKQVAQITTQTYVHRAIKR